MNYQIILLILISILIISTIYIYNKKKIKYYNLIKTYIIENNHDNTLKIEKNYNLKNINYEKIISIKNNNIDRNYLYENNIINFKNLNYNDISRFLSHIKTWEKIIEDNVKYGIILEDNIKSLDKLISDDIINNINKLPNNWNILLLNKEGAEIIKLTDEIFKVNNIISTNSYIINNITAKYLLENIFPIKKTLEKKLSDLSKNLINIYIINKNDMNIY